MRNYYLLNLNLNFINKKRTSVATLISLAFPLNFSF